MRFYGDSVEISTDTWVRVLMDRTVTEECDLIVLRLVYVSEDHTTHAAEVAPHLNYRGHTPVNSQVFECG